MSRAFAAIYRFSLPKFYQNGICRQMCSYNKDLSKPLPASGTDLLMLNLKQAGSTKAILDMVSLHGKIMNNKHIMQALRSLFTLQKAGSSEYSTKQILSNQNFNKLCRQLKFQAGAIELNETIEALKVVSYVGVPSHSTIVQVLLQLLRHNINHLTLPQIIFMDFLLNQFNSTPLSDALKIALPLVFEINLSTKLDYENPTNLADCLYYAVRHQLSQNSIQLIVNSLMKVRDTFDFKVAKSIVWSICDLPPNELYGPLMKNAINSLMIHFDELKFTDLETTLSKLTSRFTVNHSKYCFDEVFFDSCANYLIDNDLGFKKAIYFLRKFVKIGYSNNYLLDYVANKVHEDPKVISEGDVADLYSLSIAISLTEYRPVHWNELKELIATSKDVTKIDKKEVIWINFAAALCLLDIFKIDVLNKSLDENYLRYLFRKRIYNNFENLSIIWQSLKLYKPELSCILPSKFSPEILVNRLTYESELPLEAALHKALGGEKYIISDIYSKLGHHIDHVIIFRQGGYPVAHNLNEISFIEDVEVGPNCQVVIVQGLESYCYTLNKRRLKYSTIFSLKTLENKGYIVVSISLEVWQSLADFEKIPFIMQAIKEKTDNAAGLSTSENVL